MSEHILEKIQREISLRNALIDAVDKWTESNGKLSADDVEVIVGSYVRLLSLGDILVLFERVKRDRIK